MIHSSGFSFCISHFYPILCQTSPFKFVAFAQFRLFGRPRLPSGSPYFASLQRASLWNFLCLSVFLLHFFSVCIPASFAKRRRMCSNRYKHIPRHKGVVLMKYGIIGAGSTGKAAAAWLHQAGCPALVWDRSPRKRADLAQSGLLATGKVEGQLPVETADTL